jgi:hypothetical protein
MVKRIYILFNHVERGANIFSNPINYKTWGSFPVAHEKGNFYRLNSQSIGGVVCKGPANPGIKLGAVIDATIRLWWFIDGNPTTKTTSFPGSCTGTAETIGHLIMKNFNQCPNIKEDHSGFSCSYYPMQPKEVTRKTKQMPKPRATPSKKRKPRMRFSSRKSPRRRRSKLKSPRRMSGSRCKSPRRRLSRSKRKRSRRRRSR